MAVVTTKTTARGLAGKMVESASAGPSSWAQRMLQKQGWKEGDGLGKNRHGAVSHIRVTKKDDALGLGFTATAAAKSTTAEWMAASWSAAFGTAAMADPYSSRIGGAAATTLSDSESDSSDSDSDAGRGVANARAASKGAGKHDAARVGGKRPRSDSSDSDSSDGEAAAAKSRGRRGGSGVAAAPKRVIDEVCGVAIPSFEELFAATGGARLGMRARADQKGKWARAEAAAAAATAAKAAAATAPAPTADPARGGGKDGGSGGGGKRRRTAEE